MLSPSEQLLYNSVRITALSAGKPIQFGTGFFWSTSVGKGRIDSLITNKHVLAGADGIQLQVHILKAEGAVPSGETQLVTLELEPGGLVSHPDSSVDLCAISLFWVQDFTRKTGKKIFYVGTDAKLIPTDAEFKALDALEEIVMVGCPNGLFDQVNGLPIFRRGITASPPGVDHAGEQQFLIDAASFPGSSGSPVFLYNSSGYYDKSKDAFMMGAMRLKLLGVLFAGPTINQSGQIILGGNPSVQVSAMMHLGQVIRANRLRELDQIITAAATETGP